MKPLLMAVFEGAEWTERLQQKKFFIFMLQIKESFSTIINITDVDETLFHQRQTTWRLTCKTDLFPQFLPLMY